VTRRKLFRSLKKRSVIDSGISRQDRFPPLNIHSSSVLDKCISDEALFNALYHGMNEVIGQRRSICWTTGAGERKLRIGVVSAAHPVFLQKHPSNRLAALCGRSLYKLNKGISLEYKLNKGISLEFGNWGSLIGNGANCDCELNGRRLGSWNPTGYLLFLALFGLSAHAWPQQVLLPSSTLIAETALPDAPSPKVSSPQQAPEPSSPASIHGSVMDGNGAACEGVRVVLDQASRPTSSRAVTTDSSGRFDFPDVPAGEFKLTLSANGFAAKAMSGTLHSGESYETPSIVLRVTAVSEVRVTATQQEIAEEQVRQEEKQRVFGVIPNFYVTYVPDAPPLTTRQKFGMAWKSSTDPVTFLIVGAFAGVEQATNDFSGYGQGAEGYGKRFAAGYADTFIGAMIGGAILPSMLKQDPRYFYKGTGTTRSRVLYALAMSVICKGDDGHWQPNYSGIVGGLAAGGISNLYYPASNRDGLTLTFENALIGTAGGAVQNLFQEFFVRKLTPKVPDYGLSKP
jgi:hypothetical protein